jgi:hypothetical protein
VEVRGVSQEGRKAWQVQDGLMKIGRRPGNCSADGEMLARGRGNRDVPLQLPIRRPQPEASGRPLVARDPSLTGPQLLTFNPHLPSSTDQASGSLTFSTALTWLHSRGHILGIRNHSRELKILLQPLVKRAGKSKSTMGKTKRRSMSSIKPFNSVA